MQQSSSVQHLILPFDWLSAPAGCSLLASAPSNRYSAAIRQRSRQFSPPPEGEGSDSWRPNKLQPGQTLPGQWWPLASGSCSPGRIFAPHLEGGTSTGYIFQLENSRPKFSKNNSSIIWLVIFKYVFLMGWSILILTVISCIANLSPHPNLVFDVRSNNEATFSWSSSSSLPIGCFTLSCSCGKNQRPGWRPLHLKRVRLRHSEWEQRVGLEQRVEVGHTVSPCT